MIRHETIEGYLTRLSSGHPTPGGGATGALQLAQAAGLLAMAARFSEDEELARRCTGLGTEALAESDADESGFAEVADAFQLPKDTEEQRSQRSGRIQEATVHAAEPPQHIVDTSGQLLAAAEKILAHANPNVFSDVGAALGAVRAGVTAAIVTLETNLGPLRDDHARQTLREDIDRADRTAAHAQELIRQTRSLIRG